MSFDPNSTETNSSNESKGRTFGLDGDLFVIAVFTIFFFLSAFTLLFTILKWSIIFSLIFPAIPAGAVFAWIFLLKQGKPPGYDIDWYEQFVNGHGWSYNQHQQPTNRDHS